MPCNNLPLSYQKYVWIDKFAFSMEMTFNELSLVDDSIVHFEFAVAVIPSFFVLSLVLVFKPVSHRVISYI